MWVRGVTNIPVLTVERHLLLLGLPQPVLLCIPNGASLPRGCTFGVTSAVFHRCHSGPTSGPTSARTTSTQSWHRAICSWWFHVWCGRAVFYQQHYTIPTISSGPDLSNESSTRDESRGAPGGRTSRFTTSYQTPDSSFFSYIIHFPAGLQPAAALR